MKKYLYYLLLIFCIQACYGPEKLIQKEKYDRVLTRMQQIAKSRKAIPVKWAMAAEQALVMANADNWHAISELEKSETLAAWKGIYYLANKIHTRQKKIFRLLPIEAETGYRAGFYFSEPIPKILEAKERVAKMYMAKAKEELDMARAGSKKAAKQCVYLLDSVYTWRNEPDTTFHDINDLMNEATELAQVKVAILIDEPEGYKQSVASDEMNDDLPETFADLNHRFLTVEVGNYGHPTTDYLVYVSPIYVAVSSDELDHSSDTYSKEIKTGEKEEKYWCKKDSCYKIKIIEIWETITGTLHEYNQYKDADMKVLLEISDLRTSRLLEEKKFYVSESFDNDYYEVSGDERAIEHVPILGSCSMYPSDHSMINDMSRAVSYRIKRFIARYDWWYE